MTCRGGAGQRVESESEESESGITSDPGSQDGDISVHADDSCRNNPVQKLLHEGIEQATIDAAERRS